MISFLKKKIDIKLILILALFYLLVSTVSFFKVSYFKIKGLRYQSIKWGQLILEYYILDYVLVMLFIILSSAVTKHMIEKGLSWGKTLVAHITFGLLLGFFIYLSYGAISIITSNNAESIKINIEKYINNIVSVIDLNFLIYFSMTLSIYAYYYMKKNTQAKKEKAEIENKLINAKLSLLKSNLQPHFLFNTLNSISSLIEIDTKQAKDTIADLGYLLRELLDSKDLNLTTLKRELDLLVRYINILEIRFSDHFSFSSDIDDDLLEIEFPNLLLQPIIENSIKHGYSYSNTILEIYLSVSKEEDYVCITISNNGKLLDKEFTINNDNSKIGLNSIIQRLETIYNDNFEFYMENKKTRDGVITHIKIPFVEASPVNKPYKLSLKSV